MVENKKIIVMYLILLQIELKMVADAVQLSTKAGKANEDDRKLMGEFLNFCPVISYSGTRMIKYDESKLLQQLKRAYAERALKEIKNIFLSITSPSI